MAAKENSPVKTLMIINTVLVVGLIAVILFLPQKTNGEKVGYFIKDDEPEPTITPAVV